ncbi:MAG TPA: DUF6734 family protein [Niastella sp.]
MKIVQSCWSKPGYSKDDNNRCGWLHKKYNYFSWALSALQFRKFYDELELVTDKLGYDLLINKLELPYTRTRVVLDDLAQYHADLFALGKLYAYSIQEQPFIHADADVFIWRKFPEALENASLVCQNKEDSESYSRLYTKAFVEIAAATGYYPEVLEQSIERNNRIIAVNAGIMGGSNRHFFEQYTKEAFDFVDRVHTQLHKINVKDFNTIFEQFLFHALAEDKEAPVCYLRNRLVLFWYDIADFTGVPVRTEYIHLIGNFKRTKRVLDQLEHRLLLDYPEYYFRIMNLIRTNQI